MSDGDKVYKGALRLGYERAYEQICEGHFPPQNIAYDLLDPLLNDIKHADMSPIELLKQVASRLDDIESGAAQTSGIDWLQEAQEVERLARKALLEGSKKRDINFALDAGKMHFLEVMAKRGERPHFQALVFAYLRRLYEAKFEGAVLSGRHHCDISDAEFRARLAEVRPFVDATLRGYADTIVRTQSLSGLRRPSQLRARITADSDLLNWR